ncbi:MAG: hypothetical protein F6J89_20570 [Symploca sp. SIO1C4]|uniref:Uncharacterized protein n=1 Tax=Symploca sp. SIO1C4 TaxID=2607765 RepID=A0A6B3NEB0_9CYAN|nr:hypothetical protein [Symploca sp. SIO1C4]
MAYSDFKLSDLKKKFSLELKEQSDLFSDRPEVKCSDYLDVTLKYNLPLAVDINTEKARSELIIAPILLEMRRQLNNQVSLFSGVDFNVDSARGLNGVCDFLVSCSTEQLFITAPIMTLVEAKNENIKGGLGQCGAEMIAAKLFNEQEENNIKIIYGTVTTGTLWRFLKLEGRTIYIDTAEYYIGSVDKILGILLSTAEVEPVSVF